jgi:hypothetical protein
MHLQWKWQNAGMMPTKLLRNLLETDPFGMQWSELATPTIIAAQLDAQDQGVDQEVQIRTGGQPGFMTFVNVTNAAQWIRKELVEEQDIVLHDTESMTFTINSTGQRILVTSTRKQVCVGMPGSGDEVVEVEGLRRDAQQMWQKSQSRGPLRIKFLRGRSHVLHTSTDACSQSVCCEPVGPILSLNGGNLETLFVHLQAGINVAKQRVMHMIEGTCKILGSKENLGKDWKEAVREATDDGTAEAFWLNVAKPAKVPVFTSEQKAMAYVTAVQHWFFCQAKKEIEFGSVERCARQWLQERLLSVEVSLETQNSSIPVESFSLGHCQRVECPAFVLPDGTNHSPMRQVTGILGVVLTWGRWSGAFDWASGDEELQIGVELDIDFFRQIGSDVVDRVAKSIGKQAYQALAKVVKI